MKRFLAQLIFFSISAACLFIVVFIVLNYSANHQIESFKVDNSINKLIIGDSHTQNGINDEYLPHTKNFSHSSESLMYSFFKLRTLLKNNSRIDTIFLGVSFHSFAVYFDDCYINPEIASTYFFILPPDVQRYLLRMSADRGKLIQYSFKKSWNTLIRSKEKMEFLGFYKPYFTKIPLSDSSVKERVRGQYFAGDKLSGFSNINILYFKKTIQLCKENKVAVIILNTPMHKKYIENVPAEFKNQFYALIRNAKAPLFDFSSLITDDSDFLPDGDHLSPQGSTKASIYLNDNLRSMK